MKSKLQKEVEKELNYVGAIRWGLATTLKYDETIKYICGLKKEIELLEILRRDEYKVISNHETGELSSEKY